LKSRDAEIESLRKRELWMRAALTKAKQAGFMYVEEDGDGEVNGRETPGSVSSTDAVVLYKQLRAQIQTTLVDQARLASERISEAEHMRNNAIQEAAYYRAKLGALEASSDTDFARAERSRAVELEKQLTTLTTQRVEQEAKITQISQSLASQTVLLKQAEVRAADAAKRSDLVEKSHERALRDLSELQDRHASMESSAREHEHHSIMHSSLLEQKEAEIAG